MVPPCVCVSEVPVRCVSSPSSPSRVRKMDRSTLSCDHRVSPHSGALWHKSSMMKTPVVSSSHKVLSALWMTHLGCETQSVTHPYVLIRLIYHPSVIHLSSWSLTPSVSVHVLISVSIQHCRRGLSALYSLNCPHSSAIFILAFTSDLFVFKNFGYKSYISLYVESKFSTTLWFAL